MTIFGLARVLLCEPASRHGQNRLSSVPKKILTWIIRKPGGGLKLTVDNRVTTRLTLYQIIFCSFLFLLSRVLFSLAGYAQKACQHILDMVGLSQAEV